VAGYIKGFLFDPEQLGSPISSLSGGEQNRLLLAKAFLKPANLVVLDEPTNDLDMETLDLLEDLLAGFEGTVLLISHDRDFLDRLVTQTLVFDGAGGIEEHAGGYSDYLLRVAATSIEGGSSSQKETRTRKEKKATLSSLQAKIETDAQQKHRAKEEAPSVTACKKKGKLSFKHKHALEGLPKDIETIANEIKVLEEKLNDPNLFTSNPDAFNR